MYKLSPKLGEGQTETRAEINDIENRNQYKKKKSMKLSFFKR